MTRSAASATDRSGTPAVSGGCPPERSGSLQETGIPATPAGGTSRPHQVVACGRPPGLPHATRCSMRNRLSAPLPAANRGGGVRALPADALDLPHVTTMRRLHDAPPVLQGRDRAVTPR